MKKTSKRILGIALAALLIAVALVGAGAAGTVTTEGDLKSAVAAGGTVTLGANINLTSTLEISNGKTVTLDLNGYVLNGPSNSSVITQNNGTTLTIKSTETDRPHYFKVSDGTTEIGGQTYPEGLWVWDKTMEVSSGEHAGYRMVTGGCITGGNAVQGGGICCGRNNSDYDSILTLTNVNIIGNMADSSGGGVYFKTNSVGSYPLTMEDCYVAGNRAYYDFNQVGTGGGVAFYDSTLVINGGTIESNCAYENGGGLYVGCIDTEPTVTITGKVVVKDNKAKHAGSDYVTDNLNLKYLMGAGRHIPITLGSLSDGSSIGVTLDRTAGAFTTNGTADDVNKFSSDKTGYAVSFDTDHLAISLDLISVYKGVASTGTYKETIKDIATWYLDGQGTGIAKADFFETGYPTTTSLFVKSTVADGTYYSDTTTSPAFKIAVKSPSVKTNPTAKSSLTYKGEDQVLIAGGVASDTLEGVTPVMQYAFDQNFTTVITDVNSVAKKDAGTYTVYYRAVILDSQQAVAVKSATGNVTNTIGKKQLTITGTLADGKTYDGTTAAVIGTQGTVSGKVDGDDVIVTGTGTFADKNAGNGKTVNLTYAVSGTASGNYLAPVDDATIADITAATLTVTPDADQSKYVGEQDPTLTYTSTGAVTGETAVFDGALSRESGEAVGTYEILQGTLALTDNGSFLAANYTLSVTPDVAFTIKPNYYVTFDGNGATSGSMDAQEFKPGVSQELTENAFDNEGYSFGGWAIESEGNPVYVDEQEITVPGDTTLYAYWIEGEGSTEKVPEEPGEPVNIQDSPAEEGVVSSVTFTESPGSSSDNIVLVFTAESEEVKQEEIPDPDGLIIRYPFDINVYKNGDPYSESVSAVVEFTVDKSAVSSTSGVKLAHWIGTEWEYLDATLIPEDDDKYVFTAEVDSFSPFAIVGPNPSSGSSVTSFFGEKNGNDFTFDKAVVITKATLPGASSATVTNTSGAGWYNCNLTTDSITGNGILYFQVPLDVLKVKGYTINDVSLVGSKTTYLKSENGYAKYSAVITKGGALTIDFEEDATTTTAAEKVQEVVEQKQTATEQKQAAAEKVQETVEQKQTAVEQKQTAAKSPFPVLGILASIGIAGLVALRRR